MRIARLLTFLLSPLCAWAGAVGVAYNYETYGNTLDGPLGTTSGPCTAESFVSQTLSISNCSSAPGVTTSARVLSTFTTLKADSSITLANVALPAGLGASAYGRFEDTLLLGSPQVQSLSMTMHVTGTMADSGISLSRVALSFGFDYEAHLLSSGICSVNLSAGTQVVDMTCTTATYSIAMFQQHPYWFSLSTQENENPSASPVSGSASVNFFSTATLTSVQPYDANGRLVTNAIVSSQGNGGVNFDVAGAPEPYSVGLCGLGLAILGWAKRAKKS
jgi:hypothetical protein